MFRPNRIGRLFLIVIIFGTGCGYHLVGRGGTFPPGVTKIAVMPFANQTGQYGLEGEVSAIFIKELMSTGKVEIADKRSADAWFEGVIKNYQTNAISYTVDGEVRERRLLVTARVLFLIKGEEKPFFAGDNLTGKAEYEVTNDLVTDSEAEREATTEALSNLASRIINQITEGF